jgi:hypothetical protein
MDNACIMPVMRSQIPSKRKPVLLTNLTLICLTSLLVPYPFSYTRGRGSLVIARSGIPRSAGKQTVVTGLPAFRGVSLGLHRQGRRGGTTEIASPAFQLGRNDNLWPPVTERLL